MSSEPVRLKRENKMKSISGQWRQIFCNRSYETILTERVRARMCAEGLSVTLSGFILSCSGKASWIKVAPGTKKGLAVHTRQYSKAALPETALPANLIYSALTWMTGEYSAAWSDGEQARVHLPGFGCPAFHAVGSSISKASFVTRWSTNTPVMKVWCCTFFWFVTPD